MYLVENGGDIYINDEHCLRYSSKNGHLEIVKYLLNQGCDINISKKWANPYILQWLMDYELKTNDINKSYLVKI